MKVCYFPGCTLKNKAKELDLYARACAEALGVIMDEPDEWQCCGGVFSTACDEIASKLSAVRALNCAKERGEYLVTVCSACHNVIKQTNHAIRSDPTFASRVNNYMMLKEPYRGETKVIHYLELLRDVIGFDGIKRKAVKPLDGIKIAAYYGCLLLRPESVMQTDDVENPSIMEDFIKALGAEPVIYPYRNECCGGYVVAEDRSFAEKKSAKVIESAEENGAQLIVTACPLCKYNLEQAKGKLPVVYITELLADVLGIRQN